MTFLNFVGCALVAFSPTIALFALEVARKPHMVILFILSGFVWLVSLFVAGIWWSIIPFLRDQHWWAVIWSVLFQEMFRVIFFLVLRKSEDGLKNLPGVPATDGVTRQQIALVSGLGFGFISAVMQFNAVLTASLTDATLPAPGCTGTSFYLVSSLMANLFISLNVAWMIIGLNALETKQWSHFGAVVVSHLVASFVTLFNSRPVHCGIPIGILVVEAAVLGALAYMVALKRVNGTYF